MNKNLRIALTGFMGVGKSSVARHVAHILGTRRVDLDAVLEDNEGRSIAEIIDAEGEVAFREIETKYLRRVLEDPRVRVLSLGGGAWTIPANREMLKKSGYTSVWLESTFEHCWLNITFSRKDRPLARDKQRARKLFDARQSVYCLADWHFIIRPDSTSYDVAKQVVEEIFS
jgi:shikimate kinase